MLLTTEPFLQSPIAFSNVMLVLKLKVCPVRIKEKIGSLYYGGLVLVRERQRTCLIITLDSGLSVDGRFVAFGGLLL